MYFNGWSHLIIFAGGSLCGYPKICLTDPTQNNITFFSYRDKISQNVTQAYSLTLTLRGSHATKIRAFARSYMEILKKRVFSVLTKVRETAVFRKVST